MRYMIVEHFRDGNPEPVYERLRERGCLAPDGLRYIDSWVTHDLAHCCQLMECDRPILLNEWIAAWSDLVEFAVHPVISSTEAAERAWPWG